MKLHTVFLSFIVILMSLVFFMSTVKGKEGNPIYYQTEHDTRVGGPFEASNSSSRYALTESIVKDNSFLLTENLARFASPDVVDYKGKFISIFTPGLSILGVPLYIVGKHFGMPQLFTYFTIILFACVNILLVQIIVRKMSGSSIAGLLAGFTFAFATNAFPYALTFTQHQATVTIILLALLCVFGKTSFWKNVFFGLLFGAGVLIDIPNAILLFPIGLYIFSKHFSKDDLGENIKVRFKLIALGVLIGIIPCVMFFAWYNYQTTGSYTKIGQSIGRTKLFRDNLPPQLSADVIPEKAKIKNSGDDSHLPFNSRLELNGFYTLLVSNERSWIFYSPVVFLGIVGLIVLYRKKEKRTFSVLVTAIITVNILMYAMFGDPWGGWAFGPRYLIPSASLLCIGLGIGIAQYKKNILFILCFALLFSYSVYINTLGAMTTNSIPPKVEAVNLPDPIPYTYEYNYRLLEANQMSSLVYNMFLQNHIEGNTYFLLLSYSIISLGIFIYVCLLAEKGKIESRK